MGAITRWLEEKMRQARYDLRGPGRYSGEIPGLVQVEAENLEEARVRLREALEEKLVEMLRAGLPVEGFSGVDSRLDRFRGLVLSLWELMQENPAKDAGSKPSIEKGEGPPSEPGPEGGASAGQDTFLEAWLKKRGVEVQRRPSPEGEEREKVFARLAFFLGERFSSLERVYEKLKWSLATRRQFELSLAEASQEEIANSTQLCTLLKQYAFLTSYYYKSGDRLIRAKVSTEPFVQNFLTGGWLERYVKEKLTRALRARNLPHEVAMGYQVLLPGGEPMELDLLVGLGGRVFWFETKTGEFQAHLPKYVRIRKLLGLRPEEAFLVVLGMDKARAKELSALHGMTVTSEATVLEAFLESLENA